VLKPGGEWGISQGREDLMARNNLSDEAKEAAVLELIQGRSTMSEICTRYGISQTYLYKLRDQALEAVKSSVKGKRGVPKTREQQLEAELKRAKQLIADQALVIDVLKKTR
jgi:transposase-like protein